MGALDKLLEVFHMDGDDDEFGDPYEGEPRVRQRKEPTDISAVKQKAQEDAKAQTAAAKPQPSKNIRRQSINMNMEVCVIKPTGFEDSQEIMDTLLTGRPVILNVEGLNVDIAQRIIDVCCGATYAIHGSLQKVSNFIFILTPANVDISGDLQNMLNSFGITATSDSVANGGAGVVGFNGTAGSFK